MFLKHSDEKYVLRISECVVGAFHDAPLKFLVEEAGWNSAGNGLFHILIPCHIYSFPLSLSDFHLILPHSFPPFSLSYYISLFLTHNISIVIVALSTLKRKCKAVYGVKKTWNTWCYYKITHENSQLYWILHNVNVFLRICTHLNISG